MGNIRTYSKNARLIESRREQLVEVAAKVFARRGFNATTTRQLAKACNLGSGTMYHYLGSKSDILRMILDYVMKNVFQATESRIDSLQMNDPIEKLAEAIRIMYQLGASAHDYLNVLLHQMIHLPRADRQLFVDLSRRRVAVFERLVKEGVFAGVFHIVDAHHAAQLLVFMDQMWSRRYILLRDSYTLSQHIELLVHEALAMLGTSHDEIRRVTASCITDSTIPA